MCGIYGILQLDGSPAAAEALQAMGQVTIHRGPDDEGAHADGPLAFGMRRLSIIDLAGGHQPLSNEDGTLWLVANGEIYNYQELRRELTAQGHRFKTGSDCETILHLYEEHGDDCVQHLNGMFAFALWDARRRRLLIGRDRLGIKPIYLCSDGKRLLFASEAKAILAVPGVKRRARPGRVVLLPRPGLCAGAAVDLPRHPQTSAGDAAGRRRRPRRGAALLAHVRATSIARSPRTSGSRACVRSSRNRCGCKW